MIRPLSNAKYSRGLNIGRSSNLTFALAFNLLVKRLFDMVFSLIGLIILSPFFLYIVHLIRRDTHGPAFYWGKRAGLGGNPFRMLKFRTMYECEESYSGPRVTCKHDDRITPIGHWLRDSKINELPQLWNVLIGKMSFVGPRPEDPEIVKTWPDQIRKEILSVKPGITSPASILYHDEETLLSASNVMGDYMRNILPDKLRLDRLYGGQTHLAGLSSLSESCDRNFRSRRSTSRWSYSRGCLPSCRHRSRPGRGRSCGRAARARGSRRRRSPPAAAPRSRRRRRRGCRANRRRAGRAPSR